MKKHGVHLLRASALFALVAAATLFAFVSGSAAQPSAASANGHGALSNGGESGDRQFSFSARKLADGSVTGHAVLVNPAFDGDNGAPYQLEIDLSCMHVVGNIAVFGGTTRRTNDASLVDAVFFSVQDNGEPGGGVDKISRVFFWDDDPATTGDPQACLATLATDFPLETIDSGNIQVRG